LSGGYELIEREDVSGKDRQFADLAQCDTDSTNFHTEEYIDRMLEQFSGSLSETDAKIIDRLCKKIDVVRSIKKRYTSSMSRQLTDESISPNYEKRLLDLFLVIAGRRRDYKILNSAFKLTDLLEAADEYKDRCDKLLSRMLT